MRRVTGTRLCSFNGVLLALVSVVRTQWICAEGLTQRIPSQTLWKRFNFRRVASILAGSALSTKDLSHVRRY
jgi:hypothetical protein